MPKPTVHTVSDLQVGMHFTGPLFNRRGEILLPAYYPIQHEHLADWAAVRFDEIYTHGFLVEDLNQLRSIIPGHVDIKLAHSLDLYYQSMEMLQIQFGNSLARIDMERLQKIASLWIDLLVKEQNPHLLFKTLRYAAPLPKDYFCSHALDVSILSMALLFRTDRSTVRLMQIAVSGLIFDIGMLKLPMEYREDDVSYSPEMRQELKKHPIYGYQLITQDFRMPAIFGLGSLEHHERFDGSGYPRNLSGIRISQYASIIGLADVITAQMRERFGRPPREPVEILKDFVATGMNAFSPELISIFLNYLTIYPVTSILTLSTGETVTVVETFSYAPLRPTVMVLCNEDGSYNPNRKKIILSEEENSSIRVTGIFNHKLMLETESIHIKPVTDAVAARESNPNLKNLMAPSQSTSKNFNDNDDSKEINVRL